MTEGREGIARHEPRLGQELPHEYTEHDDHRVVERGADDDFCG